jgi:hypothetical protein
MTPSNTIRSQYNLDPSGSLIINEVICWLLRLFWLFTKLAELQNLFWLFDYIFMGAHQRRSQSSLDPNGTLVINGVIKTTEI